MHKTLALYQVRCVSVLPLLSFNIPIVFVVVRQIVYQQIVGVVLFTNCRVFGFLKKGGNVEVYCSTKFCVSI